MAADSRVIFSTELDESGMKHGLNNLGSTIKKLAYGAAGIVALKAIGSALVNVAKSAMAYNSQMEQYYTSFSTLLGSEEAAAEKIAYLKEFAAKTPFEMTDLANAEKTLLGFGVASDKADVAMQKLGDISQGNSERFSSLALVYGQVSSTGYLMGQDLLQMINAGFNPLTSIAEKTGTSIGDLKQVMSGGKTSAEFKAQLKAAQAEVKKLGDGASDSAKMLAQIGEEGKISADMVDQAMTIATSEGGRFYQAMEKQSKTAAGMVSTLKDNVNALGGEVFSSLSEDAKADVLPTALGYVDTLTETLKEKGVPGMLEAFGTIMGDIAGKASSFAPQVAKTVTGLVKSFTTGIKANAGTIAKGLSDTLKAAVRGIVDVLPTLLDTFVDLSIELIDGLADALPDILPELADAIFDTLTKLITNVPRLLNVGAKMAASLVLGVTRGLASLANGIASLFAESTADKMQSAVSKVKAGIKPTISAEDQQKITDTINQGIADANTEHDVTVTINGQISGIREQQDSVFAGGADEKLGRKQAGSLTKSLNAQVDAAISDAQAHLEEKKKEYETSLVGLVDASGLPLLDKSEITELSDAVGEEVTSMTTELDTTRDQYNALIKTIRDNGGTWTAEQILELNTLLTQIAEIEGKLKLLNDETAQAGEAKVGRVKRGTGTEEEFNYSVGYEKQKYANQVADIDENTNAALAENQTTIDTANDQIKKAKLVLANVNATDKEIAKAQLIVDANQALVDSATAAIDAASEAGEQAKSDALTNFNDEMTALYEGMAKENPDAAAALQNYADLRDRLVALNAVAEDIQGVDNEALKAVADEIESLWGDIYTPSEIKAGTDPNSSDYNPVLAQQVTNAVATMEQDIITEFKKSSAQIKENPLVIYLQTLLDNGAFDTLDVTTMSGNLASAFKTAVFLTDMQGVGKYAVDGITAGIGIKSGAITAEDMAVVREAYIAKLKEAFGINSPATTMKPIGGYLVDGITAGMEEESPDVEAVGTSVVDSVATGIKYNRAARNALHRQMTDMTDASRGAAYSGGFSLGTNIMHGISAGLTGSLEGLNSTMRAIVRSLLETAKRAAGVHSPSTLFRDQLGNFLAQGVGVGFTDTMNSSVLPSIAASVGEAAKAGQAVLDNTLLARVQRITGLQIPNVVGLTNAVMRGSAIAAAAGVTNNSTSTSTSTVNYTQNVNFESTMQAPDEVARAMRKIRTYGLAGAKS